MDRLQFERTGESGAQTAAEHAPTIDMNRAGHDGASASGQAAELRKSNAVQAKGALDADDVHAKAASGVSGAGGSMPHGEAIQASFGHHDISGVKAHVGGKAADASKSIGATAYATGNDVAFSQSPDLHTAAHEAAHVVQQRAGVALKDGIGREGDSYERHADAVADAVVAGKSAAPMLDEMAGKGASASPSSAALQLAPDPKYSRTERKLEGQKAGQSKAARTAEMAKEDATNMSAGVAGATGWDQEMSVLRDNGYAVYDRMKAGFRTYCGAMYEAFENHQMMLAYAAERRAERAALVSTIVGIGLAVASAGAGSLAAASLGRVAGRFSGFVGATGRATTAINEGAMELFKQGIQVAGGGVLKMGANTPQSLSTPSSVRALKDDGLAAIDTERADFTQSIATLTNNRSKLEGTFSPASIVADNAVCWAEMKAGAQAMEAAADTKKLETGIWENWLAVYGKETYTTYSCAMGAQQRERFAVPKEVLEHLSSKLGITEARARQLSGL